MHRSLIAMLAALAVLVAAIARPTGVMAVASSGGLTYEICSAGALRAVTVAPDAGAGDAPSGETAEGAALCKFFAAQAALPAAQGVAPGPAAAARRVPTTTVAAARPPSPLRPRHPPRAPPAP